MTTKGSIEVQGYGLDSNQKIVCCGVRWVKQLTSEQIWRIADNWKRWRKWYDNKRENRKRNYPAKGSEKTLAWYGIHPIDNPKQIKWLKLPTKG